MEHRPGRGRGIAAIVLLVLGAVILGGVTVAKAVAPPARYTEGKAVGWQMAPTYTNGESIYLEPVAKGGLRRGDIVLASVPWSLQKTQMNRVIAVGGDRIRYKPSSKITGQYRLVLNGEPLDEPYLEQWKNPSAVAFDVKVPKGYVFLMADNRMNSDGSQYANNGPVPAAKVASKVVAYPMAKLAVWGQLAGVLVVVVGGVLGFVARRARKRAPEAVPADRSVPEARPAAAEAGAAAPGERADVQS
ncbi:signal peptidase I [Streptomyces sp. NBC_00091]|uniref:signal peptidase I n=1 Tax=Streptomyces sp. NBC_00091 TaxID=2975648 RepID=UPI002250624C|nr:signal peptidase I [Streptomyces sp. NBC_00091]MCX5378046.1 signal peptidase I [Streptomyces sp. NBC_00091]